MEISIVRFKRTEESQWERGLEVNNYDRFIIDVNGEIIKEVYDVRDTSDLTLNLTPFFKKD